jgi:hypothetical protein
MTPKEKADELVEKFIAPTKVYHDHLGWVNYLDSAKECALIAVDEIIQSRQDDGHFDDTLSSTSSEYYTPHPMYLTYWEQVKKEIEKL